jgi:hypothetical protein
MPSLVEHIDLTKLWEVPSTSLSKTIFIEEIFQDINKQMLEMNYTLNLEQLIKIIPELKNTCGKK